MVEEIWLAWTETSSADSKIHFPERKAYAPGFLQGRSNQFSKTTIVQGVQQSIRCTPIAPRARADALDDWPGEVPRISTLALARTQVPRPAATNDPRACAHAGPIRFS